MGTVLPFDNTLSVIVLSSKTIEYFFCIYCVVNTVSFIRGPTVVSFIRGSTVASFIGGPTVASFIGGPTVASLIGGSTI